MILPSARILEVSAQYGYDDAAIKRAIAEERAKSDELSQTLRKMLRSKEKLAKAETNRAKRRVARLRKNEMDSVESERTPKLERRDASSFHGRHALLRDFLEQHPRYLDIFSNWSQSLKLMKARFGARDGKLALLKRFRESFEFWVASREGTVVLTSDKSDSSDSEMSVSYEIDTVTSRQKFNRLMRELSQKYCAHRTDSSVNPPAHVDKPPSPTTLQKCLGDGISEDSVADSAPGALTASSVVQSHADGGARAAVAGAPPEPHTIGLRHTGESQRRLNAAVHTAVDRAHHGFLENPHFQAGNSIGEDTAAYLLWRNSTHSPAFALRLWDPRYW